VIDEDVASQNIIDGDAESAIAPYPRQQINKYGCTGRSLLVLSFLRGMVLGGEERRFQLLKSPEHPDLD